MVKNPLSDGPIGSSHGKLSGMVRNPFRTPFMRKNYDAAIKAFDTKAPDFIYPSGRRCIGNAWATSFWRGFDGVSLNWDLASKQTPGYAMWCAGRDIAAALAKAERSSPILPRTA